MRRSYDVRTAGPWTLTQPHVEDPRAALLDLHDGARGKVEQRRRHGDAKGLRNMFELEIFERTSRLII
jgi:hypothetical protein